MTILASRPSVVVRPPVRFRKVRPSEYAAARAAASRQWNFSPVVSAEGWYDRFPRDFYLSHCGTAGYHIQLPYGEIGGVFNLGIRPGIGADAVRHAIDNGGFCLDCYEGFLPGYYARFGFRECGRFPFDPTMAPYPWDRANGTPDVIYMSLTDSHPGL